MKCIVCNNVIDDDSCFCKWCGNPVEEIPWIEEDGLILFESQNKKYTIVNFNEWLGAATYLELQACKRHILVYHLKEGIYVAYGYQTEEDRPVLPVFEDTLVLPEEEDYPF